jgi:hypothetical protein
MSDDNTVKNPAAVAMGRLRAAQMTTEERKAASKARWAGHVPCECGHCNTCYSRAFRARKKAAEKKLRGKKK